MITLSDHGLLERAELTVTGDYTDQMLEAITGAVVTGGVAAVEAVAGRVSRLMEVAHVSGGPLAEQALTPTVLAMIGRSLIEQGESLHFLKYRLRPSGTEVYLVPAQHSWTVLGGEDPEEWLRVRDSDRRADGIRDQCAARRMAACHSRRRPGLSVARRLTAATR